MFLAQCNSLNPCFAVRRCQPSCCAWILSAPRLKFLSPCNYASQRTLCKRETMTDLAWNRVRNKPSQCAEFVVCHENFAWRKHHTSRFGQLKNNRQRRCADDSLSRAFESAGDSVLTLFSPNGNRTLRDHPEYGLPLFAVVWYEDEDWAILCTSTEAVLIRSTEISGYRRQVHGASVRIQVIQHIWNASDPSLRVPLRQVSARIA